MGISLNVSRRGGQRNGKTGRVAGILFFSLFMVIGGVASYFLFVWPCLEVIGARNWTETPCKILSSGVRTERGSKGDTYRIEMTYSYQVNGHEYLSSRYQFMSGSSSGYGSKAEVVGRYPAGATRVCFVDPGDPVKAVVERGVTTDMLLGGLIGLVFFLIGAGGVIFLGNNRTGWSPCGSAEDPPWLRRSDWASGRLVYSTEGMMKSAWMFSGIWNLVGLPVLLAFGPEALKEGHRHFAWVLIFPALGLALLFWAFRLTRYWRAFGPSTFQLKTLPGAIGGTLEGTLCLEQPFRLEEGMTFRLTCVNRVTTGSGKERSTTEKALWQDEQVIAADNTDTLPVEFFIPSGKAENNPSDPDNLIFWRLEACAKSREMSYRAEFEVPVYEITLSPEQAAEASRVKEMETESLSNFHPPSGLGIRVEPCPGGGMSFYFSPARNKGVAMGATLFLAIWSVALYVLIHLKAPIIFPMGFGFFEILIILLTLNFWLGSTLVEVTPEEITVKKGILGIATTRKIASSEILRVETVGGMTAGQKTYQDISVVCKNGEKMTAGGAIGNIREAEWIALEMEKALGITPSPP